MLNTFLKLSIIVISLPILVATIGGIFIDWSMLTEIFKWVITSMEAFDWLIPATTQYAVFGTFIAVELGMLVFKIARWLLDLISKT